MMNRAQASQTVVLATGNLTAQVDMIGASEIEVAGTFGSVVLGTSTQPTLAERTIVAAERFKSEMSDMLFTLTGAGPVTIKVTPLKGNNILGVEVS